MSQISTRLDERKELGAFFIRLFMSTFLIYMSQDNVLDRARMVESARSHAWPQP